MNDINVGITAIGGYVPSKILTNSDLEKMVDTSDEWIVQRTGIRERRISAEDEFNTDMSFHAVEDMQDRFNVALDDVDFIVVATCTPEFTFPSVAGHLQSKLKIPSCGILDVSSACAGFTNGLIVTYGLIKSGMYKKVLFVASDTLSKIVNYTDRNTCVLFGDGAGAVLVERRDEEGIISTYSDGNGEMGGNLYKTNLDCKRINGMTINDDFLINQNGRAVFKWATCTIPKGMNTLLGSVNLTTDALDWFVPHSANLRIIDSICRTSGLSIDRVFETVSCYGNTSSASIPLSLNEGYKSNKIKKGDHILVYGFGGGLTHSGALFKSYI